MARGDGKQPGSARPARAASGSHGEAGTAAAGSARWPRFAPWLAWIGLGLVLELPQLGLPEPLRPTGEVLALLTALLACARLPRGRRIALALCAVLCGLLALYRLDRLGIRYAFGDEPLLYDQLFMIRHLFVLLGDVWSWWLALSLLAAVAALVALVLGVRALARSALRLAAPERGRRTARVIAAVWLACALGSLLPWGAKAERRWVRWISPALVQNVRRSVRTYARVQRDIGRSPYRNYGALHLRRRPDVYLILIESYGRVMVEHPRMRKPWTVQIEHMQRSLTAAGWHAVSAFTRAPVLGGRSWLAEATVLMGARVRYEAVFHQLVAQIDRVPSLHGLLRAQGYRRALLAPADRVRPGVEEADYYRYDRSVRLDDLHYHGPRVGWGIVPDQYSLGYFAKHVLPSLPRPRFVDFHMVSSHAPWQELPVLVDDFETLNTTAAPAYDEHEVTSLHKRLNRYLHGERFAYMGELHDDVAARYRDAILYDLAVLERHLLGLSDDALVIMLGDHQPPFISAETTSFDTPIHVLARDPQLLLELQDHGFTPGMRLHAEQPAAIRHEGLLSLLARTLARASGLPQETWPKYRAHGARLGD